MAKRFTLTGEQARAESATISEVLSATSASSSWDYLWFQGVAPESHVVAILGEWGSGKTLILQRVLAGGMSGVASMKRMPT